MAKRRCFISAPYGERLDTLQQVLDELEVRWDWATSTSLNEPTLNLITDAIHKSDFVIGVLHGGAPRENVLLELGMAVGLHKPLLLLKGGDTSIPPDLASFPFLGTDLKDKKLLSFQLDLFIRGLGARESTKQTSQNQHHVKTKDWGSRNCLFSSRSH